jgi:LmbE family N-acetylglucosaminyl deacetylase
MTSRKIVGVFAHPDDEALLAGGTIARYVAEDAEAAVLTCTGGEAGDNWDPTVDPAEISKVRRAELREACRRLGVGTVELLSYEDSGIPARGRPHSLAATPLEAVSNAIGAVLERHAPDVVITHDATGGYGHPDHVRACEATVLAADGLERRPLLYHAVIPVRVVDEFERAFAKAGLRAGRAAAAGADMERDVGVPDDVVTATIDVSQYVRTKRSAVTAHRTQMTGHVLFRLPWPALARLWSEEHFARAGATPGGALARDLFEAR